MPAMMLLGFLWAVAAPLLLLLPVVLLTRALACSGWPRRRRLALASTLTLAVVALLWLPPRLQFARLCDELGPPRIDARTRVDGFFLDDSTANSFGMRYLHDEGFSWLEARSIYQRDAFTRYVKQGDRIDSQEVATLSASHAVSSQYEVRPGGVSVQRTVVSERASGRVLASAASARFDGGPAKWVLGSYGSAQCPNPITAAGNAAFQATYHLARDTLRAR